MLGIIDLPVFLLTALTISLLPGPDMLYIATRSMAQGRKAGIVSVLGISTGSMCHATAAALGLSAILATSAIAFTTVKWLGAAYLLLMGLRLLFQRSPASSPSALSVVSLNQVYWQGMLTNLLNPKVALFYLALLPQFVDPAAPYHTAALLLLGGLFIAMGTLWCLMVAIFAAAISSTFRRTSLSQGLMQRISGVLFMMLGIKLALEKPV
ncbi:LysE family translocator [Phytohalomonas tamaricis]|uniref:LysE family translocator n=1 Tax=Phytohalomonas tamaricis TaxID=2081032 RepID=UPI000D0BB9A7|nr:LysE family translocator [Phytohalomonas tamaricis]